MSYDIEATSADVALEKADNEANEWLRNIMDNDGVQRHEITVTDIVAQK